MIALLLAGSIAAAISLIGTGWLERLMRTRGRSQPILELNAANQRVPQHQHKAGTPTMGGLAVLVAATLAYLLTHLRKGVVFSNQTLVMLGGGMLEGTDGIAVAVVGEERNFRGDGERRQIERGDEHGEEAEGGIQEWHGETNGSGNG